MLKLCKPKYYIVKEGQTLAEIAEAFCLPVTLLIFQNGLKEEPRAGEVLRIPSENGNLYVAKAGEGKTLLSGSEENYEKRNGTSVLYPGLKVFL